MANYHDDSYGFANYSLETIHTGQSERVSSSHAIDLRRFRRVDTRFRGWMVTEHGRVDGWITNLSGAGLRFEAGSGLPDLLMADNRRSAGPDPVIAEISFSVPAHDAADRQVVVQARILYLVEGDDGDYQCGVEFRLFAKGEQALADYLRTRGMAK